MKDSIRIIVLGLSIAGIMTAALLWADRSKEAKAQPTPEEISWVEFCKARGYDSDNHSDEIENEFLDSWVGSVEEEKAFNRLPAIE